jgi:hypothetical protein
MRWNIGFKVLVVISLLFCLPFVGSAGATCISTEQVLVLAKMSDASNLTVAERSAFLAIFDDLCNISYDKPTTDAKIAQAGSGINGSLAGINATMNATLSDMITSLNNTLHAVNDTLVNINNTVDARINNYTSWFEEHSRISEQLSSMAFIINASYAPAELDRAINTRLNNATSELDARLISWETDRQKMATKEDLLSVRDNTTSFVAITYNDWQQKQAIKDQNSQIMIYALIIICIVFGIFLVKRNIEEGKLKKMYDIGAHAPWRARNKMMPEELDEIAKNENMQELIKKKRTEFKEKEMALVKKDMEQDTTEEDLRSKLKKKAGQV